MAYSLYLGQRCKTDNSSVAGRRPFAAQSYYVKSLCFPGTGGTARRIDTLQPRMPPPATEVSLGITAMLRE